MKWGWIAVAAALMAGPVAADDLTIRTTFTFQAALDALIGPYEAASGDKVKIAAQGQPADLILLLKAQFEPLLKDGSVDAKSVADFGQVRVGFAVKAGAPVPDISTPEKFKAALLAAKSVGVSGFTSGLFVKNEVFPKLGIADAMKDKTTVVNGAIGEGVAKGQVEVGFQQMSELLPIKGITVAGRIPEDVNRATILTSGLGSHNKAPAAANRFIAYMKSPAGLAILKQLDIEPVK